MQRERIRLAWLAWLAALLVVVPTLAAEGVVNINSASESQLALLPRVGPALARRIVEFREENGGFKKPEELILVRGIGERLFETLEPYVTVKGETTLKTKVSVSRSESSSAGP